MSWTIVNFGKHMGKTLPQIVLNDPNWFFWAMDDVIFEKRLKFRQNKLTNKKIDKESKEIYEKARKILIRKKYPEERVVEYLIHPNRGKLSHVKNLKIVKSTRPRPADPPKTFRRKYFDLSIPRIIGRIYKDGEGIMWKSLIFHIFGDPDIKLTKKRCEKFFDDDNNFDVQAPEDPVGFFLELRR